MLEYSFVFITCKTCSMVEFYFGWCAFCITTATCLHVCTCACLLSMDAFLFVVAWGARDREKAGEWWRVQEGRVMVMRGRGNWSWCWCLCCNLGCYRTAAGSALPFYSLACFSDHRPCGLGSNQWKKGNAPLIVVSLKETASCTMLILFFPCGISLLINGRVLHL